MNYDDYVQVLYLCAQIYRSTRSNKIREKVKKIAIQIQKNVINTGLPKAELWGTEI